eukprot:SAG22_NODE_1635_length_3925_cov_19.715107_2_plen_64_part_00
MQYPVGRYGAADDVGHTVRFLATEEAGFITGQAIAVDGGLTIQLHDDYAGKVLEHAAAAAARL